MAFIAYLAMAVVCGFFLYVLMQFGLEETHHKRKNEVAIAFPMATSGPIAMRPKKSKTRPKERMNDQLRDESANRREIQC